MKSTPISERKNMEADLLAEIISKKSSLQEETIKYIVKYYGYYLSKSPDSLYNMGYYLDRIEHFIKCRILLQEKHKHYLSITKKIFAALEKTFLKDNLERVELIFDEFFIYNNSFDLKINENKIFNFRLDKVKNKDFCYIYFLYKQERGVIDYLIKYEKGINVKENIDEFLNFLDKVTLKEKE